MAISESKRKANKKWNDENLKVKYDRINLVVKKGEKDIISQHAKNKNESINGFVNRAIEETIQRDNESTPQ